MQNSLIWYYLFFTLGSLVTGFLSGLFGIGGGIILVPLLLYLKLPPLSALATSSLTIFFISLMTTISFVKGIKIKEIVIKYYLLILTATLSSPLGVIVASMISKSTLFILFILFLTLNLFLYERRKRNSDMLTSIIKVKKRPLLYTKFLYPILCGFTVGLLAGLLGVGGGIILIPFLLLLFDEDLHIATEISLIAITLSTLFSSATHILKGNIYFKEAALLALGGIISARWGKKWNSKLSEKKLIKAFQILLFILIGSTLFKLFSS